VLPEPYLLAHKAVNPELSTKAMPLLKALVVWYAVIGKNIYKHAMVDIHILPDMLYKESVIALYLCKVEGGVIFCAKPLKEVLRAKLRRGDLQKAVVVLAGHTHIYIVIPRDNALVIECTDSTASLNKVWDVVLLAYAVYLCQYLVEHRM